MEQDTVMRDQPSDESNAAEALLQLAQDPLVPERNREVTESQAQPQDELDEDGELFETYQGIEQLQAYLYRQQRLAGIPSEQMVSMTGERGAPTQRRDGGPVNRPDNPSVVQFSAGGRVLAPFIPPARFDGVMRPLPFEGERQGSNDEPPVNDQSAREALDLNEEIYGPEGRPDRNERTPERGIPARDSHMTGPMVAVQLTEFLEPNDLVNLYACSKNWNAFVRLYPEKIIRNYSEKQAPESDSIFPFRCYPQLCKQRRVNESEHELVPGIPWLLMVMHRERIVQSIMEWMQRTGYGVPTRSGVAIRKLWFLMDIPDTKRRKWTIEHKGLWSDMDVFLAGLFMIQIDSALQDEDEGEDDLGTMRRLLMAQKSLSVLWDVLSGEIWQTELEVVQSYVRWRYEPRPHERAMNNILGVPIQEAGLLQYESYGQHGRSAKVRRPDSLVIHELKRRKLDVPKLYQAALAMEELVPHKGNKPLQWDLALKEKVAGSGLDWRDAINLDRPKIT
ncbi:hypothetical protein P170DRAFT_462039 [Aspergillus steynii IBT 23096]|uniref:F-box domain-containing protein n=1 Tax=Aspergillus steynii IBT 23096 TaxID=1392250 RepID=A0A2I2GGC5_9EURO|nr:uncharacterized protein P170DRAFT_462039 [Aspergillus steynii IBT 23096]PLB51934.1 hypothetical protein P170DRAFT_462039 [Aspergillus steynii IBT 23096]